MFLFNSGGYLWFLSSARLLRVAGVFTTNTVDSTERFTLATSHLEASLFGSPFDSKSQPKQVSSVDLLDCGNLYRIARAPHGQKKNLGSTSAALGDSNIIHNEQISSLSNTKVTLDDTWHWTKPTTNLNTGSTEIPENMEAARKKLIPHSPNKVVRNSPESIESAWQARSEPDDIFSNLARSQISASRRVTPTEEKLTFRPQQEDHYLGAVRAQRSRSRNTHKVAATKISIKDELGPQILTIRTGSPKKVVKMETMGAQRNSHSEEQIDFAWDPRDLEREADEETDKFIENLEDKELKKFLKDSKILSVIPRLANALAHSIRENEKYRRTFTDWWKRFLRIDDDTFRPKNTEMIEILGVTEDDYTSVKVRDLNAILRWDLFGVLVKSANKLKRVNPTYKSLNSLVVRHAQENFALISVVEGFKKHMNPQEFEDYQQAWERVVRDLDELDSLTGLKPPPFTMGRLSIRLEYALDKVSRLNLLSRSNTSEPKDIGLDWRSQIMDNSPLGAAVLKLISDNPQYDLADLHRQILGNNRHEGLSSLKRFLSLVENIKSDFGDKTTSENLTGKSHETTTQVRPGEKTRQGSYNPRIDHEPRESYPFQDRVLRLGKSSTTVRKAAAGPQDRNRPRSKAPQSYKFSSVTVGHGCSTRGWSRFIPFKSHTKKKS